MSEAVFNEAYKVLNKAQKEAVDTIEGPVMVIAGPGTGKTQILTLRIANILLKTDTQPENILALTFTNSGVHAMRKRLIEIIGDRAYRVQIFTFHSFAEHVMREFSFYFPDLEFAKVVTDLEKIEILEEIVNKGGFKEIVSKFDPLSSLGQVKKAVDEIKQEGLSPEEYQTLLPVWKEELFRDENVYYKRKFGTFNAGDMKPAEKEKIERKLAKAREVGEVFVQYQTALRERGRYDFSDMILRVLRELEANENLKLDLQETYQYLLVDEHQDTNEGQNRLVELLTDAAHLEGRPNLFTVGDEKQSIYRFQGASAETFEHLRSLYRDVKFVELTENYRSTKDILDSSHSLITHTIPEAEVLNSQKKEKTPISILEFSNYKYELLYVAEDIKAKLDAGIEPKEVAVIYRSNRHIDEIKQVFLDRGIPFTVLSRDDLFEDRNISNVITLLRVIHNPEDDREVGKALFIDFLGFDAFESVEVLKKYALEMRRSGMKLVQVLAKEERYQSFVLMLKELKTREANTAFPIFFKEFLDKTGYIEHMMRSPDSRDQLLKIDTLFEEIKRHTAAQKNYRLQNFIAFVDACEKYGLEIVTGEVRSEDGVLCMTAHRSKGLEFEHVYLLNATRSNWERSRGFPKIALPIKDYKGTLDDERRLFYVAMTRAKRTLTISSSLSDWEGKEREKSQFVTEIDERFAECSETEPFERRHTDSLSVFLHHNPEKRSILDPEYLKSRFLEGSLSVTALNSYLTCEMRYLMRSLIRLPSEYTPALLYGDLVHKSLEDFFETCRDEKKVAAKKVLLENFKRYMTSSFFYNDLYERYAERGETALAAYYDANKRSWSTSITNETSITRQFELTSGEVISLTGKLDKIEYLDGEGGGRIRIFDYKTGKTYSDKSKKQQREDLDRQIIFYHLLMEGYKEGRFTVEEAILDFIEPNKKGEHEQKTIAVTKDDIERIEESINTMAHEVMSGEFLTKGCGEKKCEYCRLRKAIES